MRGAKILGCSHERYRTRRSTLQSLAAIVVSPALSHILSTTVATASYGPEKLDDVSPAPSPHAPFASAAKEFRDDPHIAGQRSNYIRKSKGDADRTSRRALH